VVRPSGAPVGIREPEVPRHGNPHGGHPTCRGGRRITGDVGRPPEVRNGYISCSAGAQRRHTPNRTTCPFAGTFTSVVTAHAPPSRPLETMVRKGSPVRVRQRAPHKGPLRRAFLMRTAMCARSRSRTRTARRNDGAGGFECPVGCRTACRSRSALVEDHGLGPGSRIAWSSTSPTRRPVLSYEALASTFPTLNPEAIA
jgi:hypothetical protein